MKAYTLLAATLAALSGCVAPEPVAPGAVPDAPVDVVFHAASGLVDAPAFGAEPPQFALRPVADRRALEPTVGVSPSGTVFFVSGDTDVFGAEKDRVPVGARSEILRSRDRGETWEVVTPTVAGVPVLPMDFDPYLYVDPTTGRLFTAELYVGCLYVGWSDDEGESWEHNSAGCGFPVNDHQTLFAGPATVATTSGYPNVLYLCTNQFVATAACTRSLDGGRSFEPARLMPFLHPEAPDRNVERTCNYPIHGHGRASFAEGTAYLPHVICDTVVVEVSRDDGATWEMVVVDEETGGSPQFGDHHEATVAVDDEGNAYVFWIAKDGRPRLSRSTDQGRTWEAPLAVGLPSVTAAVRPGIAAGSAGRVAFFYIGTEDRSGFGPTPRAMWHGYLGMTLDGLAPEPTFATVRVTPSDDPLARGDCTGRCGETPDAMYDFLHVETDPSTGDVYVAVADVCTGACAEGGSSAPRNRGVLVVQTGGVRLR
ncbi:MAG: hypothetical protein ACT4PT_09550 [Methanobacteriota archaeon]